MLHLVAAGLLNVGDDRQRALLFAPNAFATDDPGPQAYARVTRETLATQRFPTLTSLAGRRMTRSTYRFTFEGQERGIPLFADVSYPDVAIVAFSSGQVLELGRADLGLGRDDPVEVGPASRSELLRHLSAE